MKRNRRGKMKYWYNTAQSTYSGFYGSYFSNTNSTADSYLPYYSPVESYENLLGDIYHNNGTNSGYELIRYRIPVQTYTDWLTQNSSIHIPNNQNLNDQENVQNQNRKEKIPDPEAEIARERARELLFEHLDEANKNRFLKEEPIEIFSQIFENVIYKIPISKLAKIQAFKEDKIIDKLCLIVREPEQLPLEDVILAKLLHILHNEEEAIRTANHQDIENGLNLATIVPNA